MPEFDDTGLQLILAGSVDAANNWHKLGWPDSINNTLGATATLSTAAGTAISNSSISVSGAGTYSFTLTSARPWDIGTPLFVISQTNPETWVWGAVTANDGNGGISIAATKFGDSGTETLWTVIALFLLAESLETFPLERANGGLASADNEVSCNVCEYPLTISYHGTFATPPTPVEDGKNYIAAAGATGAWATHDGEIVNDAVGGWTFRTPEVGWRAMVVSTSGTVSSGADEYFDGATWRYTGTVILKKEATYIKSDSSTVALALADWNNAPDLFFTFYGAGAHTLTLPAPLLASIGYGGKSVSVMLQAGSLLTVNVSGGGTIGNALSSVTTTTLYRVLTFKCMPIDSTGSTNGHWVQSAQSP
jgi:hypothetical protein